ncbi:MAG: hypothetical protein LBS69_03760 [Prevotellaceae bacterium]|nr:hypothetical protein [Prevotellaceae bacterium]
MIDKKHVQHVVNKHYKEIIKIGLTPIEYIQYIISNYNRIYYDKNNDSYLLVIFKETKNSQNIAAMQLIFNDKHEFYLIKTALPMRSTALKSKSKILIFTNPRQKGSSVNFT